MKKTFSYCLIAFILLWTFFSSHPFTFSETYHKEPFSIISFEKEELPFVVIIPTYNNNKWYKKNLDSIFAQKYSNYRLIIIDDCSNDDTRDLIEKYLKTHNQENRCTLLKNKVRQFKMANLYRAIHTCDDKEIIIIVDGDDWLLDDRVFSYLNELYRSNDIWLTTGGYIEYPSGGNGFCRPIPTEVIEENSFRKYHRTTSQLRTFYAGLFKQIKLENFLFEGKFLQTASDVAKMMAMFELAGQRIAFNYRKLYVYNLENTINDHKVNPHLQSRSCDAILKQKPYQTIKSFCPSPEEKVIHALADIIIYSQNPSDAEKCLTNIDKLHDYKNIFVINTKYNEFKEQYDTLKKSFNITHMVNEWNSKSLVTLLKSVSNQSHILFIKDISTVEQHLYLNNKIRILERTDSYAWYKRDINTIHFSHNSNQIDSDTYAIQSEYFGQKSFIWHTLDVALYKKQDLITLFDKINFDQNSFERVFNQQSVAPKTIGLFS